MIAFTGFRTAKGNNQAILPVNKISINSAMKKTEPTKEGTAKSGDTGKTHELKTDLPLSEKDEVKQAEEKMRKAAKKK